MRHDIHRPTILAQRGQDVLDKVYADYMAQFSEQERAMIDAAWDRHQAALPRKLRPDLTPEELERFEEYGAIDFESAGATRRK